MLAAVGSNRGVSLHRPDAARHDPERCRRVKLMAYPVTPHEEAVLTNIKYFAFDLLLGLYDNEVKYTEAVYDGAGLTETSINSCTTTPSRR
ncbi:hypothetical protein ABIE78_003364 [Sinorhizobium fredii]